MQFYETFIDLSTHFGIFFFHVVGNFEQRNNMASYTTDQKAREIVKQVNKEEVRQ
jgi:hypothetical protein